MSEIEYKCPTCLVCRESATITVPLAALEAWWGGAYAQDAFSFMSAGEREMVISGTHPECWEKLFPADEFPVEVFDGF